MSIKRLRRARFYTHVHPALRLTLSLFKLQGLQQININIQYVAGVHCCCVMINHPCLMSKRDDYLITFYMTQAYKYIYIYICTYYVFIYIYIVMPVLFLCKKYIYICIFIYIYLYIYIYTYMPVLFPSVQHLIK